MSGDDTYQSNLFESVSVEDLESGRGRGLDVGLDTGLLGDTDVRDRD